MAKSGSAWKKGGAWRSRDRGDTWQRIDEPGSGIVNSDIHSITILPARAGRPHTHIICTVNSVYTNTANAEGPWEAASSAERFDGMYYTRTIQALPGDDDALLLAIGDGTPGTRSRLYRSEDRGRNWTASLLHTPPNSTFWALGTHAADPSLVFAGTKYGHLFRSLDGGRSWFKEWRDFSEITAVAWTPFEAPVKAHPQSRLDAAKELHHE